MLDDGELNDLLIAVGAGALVANGCPQLAASASAWDGLAEKFEGYKYQGQWGQSARGWAKHFHRIAAAIRALDD